MTPREMQFAFELGVNKFDSEAIVESFISFYWLNEAQNRLYKTRYSGLNSKRTGFEQTQKRVDDLGTLVIETPITTTVGTSLDKPNSYIAELPSDYFVAVGEEADIQFTPEGGVVTIRRVNVTPSTSDTYAKDIESPYSKHTLHYEYAYPLRLFKGREVELITDGNYTIPTYYLRYIKIPNKIELGGDDCELPYHVHMELVNSAVNLYLENVGDQRYQSNKQELETQE